MLGLSVIILFKSLLHVFCSLVFSAHNSSVWHIWIGRKDKCCISVVWIHPSKLKIYILKIPHIRERINFSKKRLFCKKSKCKSAKIFLLVRKIFWLIGKLFWKLGKVFCVVGNICRSWICSSYFCCFLCLFFLCLRFLYMLIPRTSPSCEMGWHLKKH